MKDKRIKVTYIISYIDKSVGFEWVASRLNRDKFDLKFILLNDKPSHLGKFLKGINIPFEELQYLGKKNIIQTAFRVWNILRKQKPDVIHTHLVDADFIGLTVGKFLGIKKRVYTRHNSNIHKKYHSGAEKFDRIANKYSTHIASISKNITEILVNEEGVSPEKIRLVYHGFELEKFENVPQNQIDELNSKYNVAGRRPVIGVISRYMHWKGIQHIIPAFKKTLEKYPNALLMLANAGKGDYAKEIVELLSDLPSDSYVEIAFEHNLFALYHLFDIFVHIPIDPEVEAFGQIYIESLAAGIPSVVTLSGIAREVISDKENAVVVDFQNSEQIVDGIDLLLTDKELREKIVSNGIKSVKEKFSLKSMIENLESLYVE